MPTPNFPLLPSTSVWDSSKYEIETGDNSLKQETEGSYTYTRPRSTRRPPRTFKGGYTYISEADRTTLLAFYDLVGCHTIFFWQNPQDLVTYTVRFLEPLRFPYRGRGMNQRWDCTMVVREA